MSVEVYLGNPPENIKTWIETHAAPPAPTARTATRVWYGDDSDVYTDYEIVGDITGDDNNMLATSQIPNVTSAKKIEIGSSVISIGKCAFYWCSNLTSVTIPNSVTSIEYGVFIYCN